MTKQSNRNAGGYVAVGRGISRTRDQGHLSHLCETDMETDAIHLLSKFDRDRAGESAWSI